MPPKDEKDSRLEETTSHSVWPGGVFSRSHLEVKQVGFQAPTLREIPKVVQSDDCRELLRNEGWDRRILRRSVTETGRLATLDEY